MATKLVCIISLLFAVSVQAQTTQPSAVDQAIAQLQTAIQSVNSQLSAAQATIASQQATISQLGSLAKSLPAGTDLGPLFAKASSANPIILSQNPNDAYVVTGSPTISQNGVVVIGFGNTLKIVPAAGASTGICVRGDGCRFYGLRFAAVNNTTTVFRLYGVNPAQRTSCQGTLIDSCTFDSTVMTGVNVDAWADNVSVQNCKFGITQAQGIYCTADGLNVHGCLFLGSVGEHPIRIDINGTTSHRPVNACISGCTISNNNIYGKEAIALRECIGFTVSDCTFPVGWIHWGQGSPDAKVHATDITARNLTFGAIRQGPNGAPGGSLLTIEHDVWASVVNVTAPGSTTDPVASITDRGVLNYRGIVLTGTPPAGKQWHAAVGTLGTGKAVAE